MTIPWIFKASYCFFFAKNLPRKSRNSQRVLAGEALRIFYHAFRIYTCTIFTATASKVLLSGIFQAFHSTKIYSNDEDKLLWRTTILASLLKTESKFIIRVRSSARMTYQAFTLDTTRSMINQSFELSLNDIVSISKLIWRPKRSLFFQFMK